MSELTIISWNIWRGKFLDNIIQFLAKNPADVICFQEAVEGLPSVENGANVAFYIAESLGRELGRHYHSVFYDAITNDREVIGGVISNYKLGQAILSRYPFDRTPTLHKLSDMSLYLSHKDAEHEPRIAVEANIRLDDEIVVRVLNTHLARTPNFGYSSVRKSQVKKLLEIVNSGDLDKTILAGDLNCDPDSEDIQEIGETLNNADVNLRGKINKGLIKSTYPVCSTATDGFIEEGPERYRPDHLFVGKGISVAHFKIKDSMASDHLPLYAVLQVGK